jgi:hypothetical protein
MQRPGLRAGLFDVVGMSGLGGKHQAFAVALVKLKWYRLGFSIHMDDDRFARPGIHQLAWGVAPRLNLNVIDTRTCASPSFHATRCSGTHGQ